MYTTIGEVRNPTVEPQVQQKQMQNNSCIIEPDGSITYPITEVGQCPQVLKQSCYIFWVFTDKSVNMQWMQYATLPDESNQQAKGRHYSCICMMEYMTSGKRFIGCE